MRSGWDVVELGKVAEVVMGQSPPGESYNTLGEGLPFIQGSAEFGRTYPSPEKWCSDPRKIAKEGDLLFSVRAPVGDRNFADQEIAIGRGLAIIRGTEHSTTTYLSIALEAAVRELERHSTGGMFASITKKALLAVNIPVPSLAEQMRIVDLVLSIDASREQAERTAHSLQSLRGNVLSSLLSGDHEIPESYDKFLEGRGAA